MPCSMEEAVDPDGARTDASAATDPACKNLRLFICMQFLFVSGILGQLGIKADLCLWQGEQEHIIVYIV